MIGIGVIGCGKISQVRHLPEYAENPGARLVGYYDLNGERASRMAEQYGGTAYGALEELLEGAVEEGFLEKEVLSMYRMFREPEELVRFLTGELEVTP